MYAIIFSRLSSKRFNNKALVKLINNKTLIEHVIDQAKLIFPSQKIILATTYKSIDNHLCLIAKKKKIKIFRGSENNVILRTINCCKKYKIKTFLRYCGDRPLIDYRKIKLLTKKKFLNYDIMTNVMPNKNVDPGLTIEIIKTSALKKIYNKKINSFYKEHITQYIYNFPKEFKIKQINSNDFYFSGNSYTIDNKSDVRKINHILKRYNPNKIETIVKLHNEYEKN